MRIYAMIKQEVLLMKIERPHYLNQLISKRENGLIKVITGVRRCGKSFLLFELYREYLLSQGVDERHIVMLALDEIANARYRNPLELDRYVREQLVDKSAVYYVFLDEIQKVADIPNPYLVRKSSHRTNHLFQVLKFCS